MLGITDFIKLSLVKGKAYDFVPSDFARKPGVRVP